MITLSWRSNRAGDLQAAYLGGCRVGYVAEGGGGWLWHLTLLRPEGGAYMGRAEDLGTARAALAGAVGEWMVHAGLCSADPAEAPPGASAGPVPSTPVEKGPIRSNRIL